MITQDLFCFVSYIGSMCCSKMQLIEINISSNWDHAALIFDVM